MDHSTRVNNLNSFIGSLPRTNIQFVFIDADEDHFEIKMQSEFRLYSPSAIPYYLTFGTTRDYCHAYKHADLTHLIKQSNFKKSKSPIEIYKVAIERAVTQDADVRIGNHLTFGTRQSRKELFFATHLTTYTDGYVDDFRLYRDNPSVCNFNTDVAAINGTRRLFRKQIPCFKKTIQIGEEYMDMEDVGIIQNLCRATIGGLPRRNKNIMKRFLQKGGGPQKYKQLDTAMSEFYFFLYETLLVHIVDSSSIVRIFHDQENELCPCGNKTLVCLITTRDVVAHVLNISVHKALKACHVYFHPSDASNVELKCAATWKASVDGLHSVIWNDGK